MDDEPLDLRQKSVISFKKDQHLSLKKKQKPVKKDKKLTTYQNAACRVKKFYNRIRKDVVTSEQEVAKADCESRNNIQNENLEWSSMTQEGVSYGIREESESHENERVMVKPNISTDSDQFDTVTVKHRAFPAPEINQVTDGQRIASDPDRCGGATDEHSSPNIATLSDSIFMEASAAVPGPSKNIDKKMHYFCEHCKNFLTLKYSTFKKHLRTHTREKPFVCKTCNKGFSRKRNLKDHSRIHTGEKLYVCDTCNKGFKTNYQLQRHIRSHTGEKTYECKICNRKYSREDNFQTHIKLHTGKKPYICKICNKTFSRNDKLKIHIRLHTGERPYACGICSKAFSSTSGKKKHESTHKRMNNKE